MDLAGGLANTPDNPGYVPLEAEPHISIEGINKTDVGTEFFGEVRDPYKKDKTCHMLASSLDKDFKDTAFVNSLDEIWKNSYSEERFNLLDGIKYHRTRNSCVIKFCSQLIINNIINEFYDSIYFGHYQRTGKLRKSRIVHGDHLGEKKTLSVSKLVIDIKMLKGAQARNLDI
ncbi:hypothetical protein O181_000544 [Austropuccinia psidii MF-1]|uniref:Uncharacterized protein n=1 Tax=Austropuccinia psidii MF-1 TaxID=1389203 RepID=A0A9Q3B8S9_9BASI|nr:hypothetical protein [Austropuccinia psidii MF-1]